MRIVLKSVARATYDFDDEHEGSDEVTDPIHLRKLAGVSCDIDFAEYFPVFTEWASKYESGYMSFEYSETRGLRTVVTYEYTGSELPDAEEVYKLVEYTSGQLSDGIGESWEQEICAYLGDTGVFISPWLLSNQIHMVYIDSKPVWLVNAIHSENPVYWNNMVMILEMED